MRTRHPAHRAHRGGSGQGQFPPLHGKGTARAPGGARRHAAADDQPAQPRGGAARTAVRLSTRSSGSPSPPAARRSTPGWSAAGGWRRLARMPTDARRGQRIPLPRPADAEQAISGCWSASPAKPPTRWRRCATSRARARRCSRWSNVPESSIARESDAVLETVAGPEIGVASTKAFTAQLAVLACFALAAGRARGTLDRPRRKHESRPHCWRCRGAPPRCWTTTSAIRRLAAPHRARRATCCIWAAAPASRSRWRAR